MAVDSLEYMINKENEIPRLIEMILNQIQDKIEGNDIGVYNKNMRTASEILKDYGLGG